jgi:WD40 repeat protein
LPNGSELLISSGDPDFGTRLWDLSQDREVRQYNQATTRARVIAISPDERTFAVIVGYRVRLFHTDDADWFRVIPAQKCSDVAFTSDGRHLIIGQADSLSIRSLASGDVVHEFAAETVRFDAIATSPDGRFLVSGGGGVWSEEQGTIVGGRRKVSWGKSTVSVSR